MGLRLQWNPGHRLTVKADTQLIGKKDFMPTISELPSTQSVAPSDKVPVSQDGVARAASLGVLLSETQPAITIESGTLLGRTSLGAGGPEPVAVGAGLIMNQGTLATADGPLRTLVPGVALSEDDRVVVSRDGQLQTLPLEAVRTMFGAGSHIVINEHGVISAVWPTAEQIGVQGTTAVSALPRVSAATTMDLVAIDRAGTGRSITVADLLRGVTIDQVSPAVSANDSDLVWVAQNGNVMSRQSFAAIWNWILSKVPTIRLQVVELTSDTVLDTTIHNGRVLICSQPVTLTPILANMGLGFHCEVINLSSGPVTFGPGVRTSSGTSILPAGQACQVRCFAYSFGNLVYASIPEPSVSVTLPGVAQNPAVVSVTASSITLSWSQPLSGTPPFNYAVQYRVAGTTSWSVAATNLSVPGHVVGDLMPDTLYEFSVIAFNIAGASALSSIVASRTTAGVALPGQPGSVSAVTQSSESVSLSWNAPASGGAVTSYTLQYRLAGATIWTGSATGLTMTSSVVGNLTASATYEFRVIANNDSGSGPASEVVSATTLPPTGAVTSIQWNMVPVGPYTSGSGAIGVNAHVTPADAAIRFGFSQSATMPPTSWTTALHVTNDIWGAYVPTPASAGTWYAWAEGADGSATSVLQTSFTVQ